MARPEKTTVEYFSHDVKGGQTLFIIESMYGNDGYAFWFKLLEIIGDKEGHSFDCGNPANWRFLLAKTRVSEETAAAIMDTLVELGAIDPDLWLERRVVWIQKFVDRLSDLYEKRKVKPEKPGLGRDNPAPSEFPTRKPQETGVSDAETPQSKVKKRKEKEREEEPSEEARAREACGGDCPPDEFDADSDIADEATRDFRRVIAATQDCGWKLPAPKDEREADECIEAYGANWTVAAIERAHSRGKSTWSYVKGILEDWRVKGGIDAEQNARASHGAYHRETVNERNNRLLDDFFSGGEPHETGGHQGLLEPGIDELQPRPG